MQNFYFSLWSWVYVSIEDVQQKYNSIDCLSLLLYKMYTLHSVVAKQAV